MLTIHGGRVPAPAMGDWCLHLQWGSGACTCNGGGVPAPAIGVGCLHLQWCLAVYQSVLGGNARARRKLARNGQDLFLPSLNGACGGSRGNEQGHAVPASRL